MGCSLYVYTCSLSKEPMNVTAKLGATLVPMAVPPICKKLTPLNWKLFFVRTISKRPIKLALVGLMLACGLAVSSAIRAAVRPSLLGMFV